MRERAGCKRLVSGEREERRDVFVTRGDAKITASGRKLKRRDF